MVSNARNLSRLLGSSPTVSSDKLAPEVNQSITSAITLAGLPPAQLINTSNDLPLSGNDIGDQVYVAETGRLYIWSGQGWYSIALINTSPAFDSGGAPESSYILDSNGGTPITIQLSATDPEDTPIQWSYVASDSAQYFADITQDSSVFTITAKPTSTIEQYDSAGGVFTITFKASDGINLATALSEFSISFSSSWAFAIEQAKIQASDQALNDFFGRSVSISSDGNTVIVGKYADDTAGVDAGAAYIFTRSGSTWSQQAKIQSSDIEAGDNFGETVSISGDGNIAIVGARVESNSGLSGAGAAYIFTRSGSTWTEQAKLTSSDIEAGDGFGYSVSISGDGNTAIVSARNEDTGASNAGAAYIFTRSGSTWSQQAKIQANDKQGTDYFGWSVSISSDGNTSIVGAPREDTGGTDAGAAYIFTRDGTTWSQQAKIQSSDIEASDQFGYSVSISGDGNTAIVSAWLEDTGFTGAGAAYIFTRSGSTWTEQAKIQASDTKLDTEFGASVSISGDGNTVIVGSTRGGDEGVLNAGTAYIFTRDGSTWTEIAKIQASDAETSDNFWSVSISSDGNTAIVGAYSEDTGFTNAGAAYIFVAG